MLHTVPVIVGMWMNFAAIALLLCTAVLLVISVIKWSGAFMIMAIAMSLILADMLAGYVMHGFRFKEGAMALLSLALVLAPGFVGDGAHRREEEREREEAERNRPRGLKNA
jgi:hypothetical protein